MTARLLMMVKPHGFDRNPQTVEDNVFQQGTEPASNPGDKALAEFEQVTRLLSRHRIDLHVFTPHRLDTPDAVFPNNWVSFHGDKTLLYPMKFSNRRLERNLNWVQELSPDSRCYDLSHYEQQGLYCEGTGSIVFDHQTKTAYAAVSERTHEKIVYEVTDILGYQAHLFPSWFKGKPVYHTNVIMGIGTHYVAVCLEVVPAEDRPRLEASLQQSGKQLIPITAVQMTQFCGNIIEIADREGNLFTLMSDTARAAFQAPQLKQMAESTEILAVSIPTIETLGGGGIRCMIAEVYR